MASDFSIFHLQSYVCAVHVGFSPIQSNVNHLKDCAQFTRHVSAVAGIAGTRSLHFGLVLSIQQDKCIEVGPPCDLVCIPFLHPPYCARRKTYSKHGRDVTRELGSWSTTGRAGSRRSASSFRRAFHLDDLMFIENSNRFGRLDERGMVPVDQWYHQDLYELTYTQAPSFGKHQWS